MAGIEQYSNLMYASEEEDQMEAISRYPYPYKIPQSTEPSYRYIRSERDLTLPLQKHKNVQPAYESPEEDISFRKYLSASVGLVSLITENLLSHPFVVLRRQCQVHHTALKYHLQPFTLIPRLVHLHQRQGVTTLWKGLGSCLLIRGMSLAVEDLMSKVTGWPKEVNNTTTLKKFGKHIFLKCASIVIVMPFYTASLVETVQSDIASEKPGVFDVFRDGAVRLLSWSAPQRGRMLPVWALVGPSISLGLSKYIFGLIVKGVSTRIMMYKYNGTQEQKGARSRNAVVYAENVEIYSNIISLIASEAVFYPFETILHRIQLQGTRTIIDNLDNGFEVVPIMTSYEGAIDCYKTTLAAEGVSGLYKGFGALILQFAAHVAVIKITKWVIGQVTELVSSKPPSKVVEYYNLDRMQHSDSTTISHSLSSISNAE